MNNNQQFKTDPKGKAITSLVLGIISVISGIEVIYIYGSYDWGGIILIVYLLFPIIGLFSGAIGLSSTKKRLAITGIILCVIGLLGTLFFYLFTRMMAETM